MKHYQPLQPGLYYHVYNRGNNKENIFREERNYDYFLSLAKKHITPIAEVLAYCLLKNHFHLLVRIKDDAGIEKTSQCFSNFFNAYAKAINKAYNRTGSLFQDRFSRNPIENEYYLKRLVSYIHLNPKYHGFTENFRDYKFSSYQIILGDRSSLVAREHIVELFGSIQSFQEAHLGGVENLTGIQDLIGIQDLTGL